MKVYEQRKKTIHEFDLNIIHEYFLNLERQGPGSTENTLKALSFIDGLTEKIQNCRYWLRNRRSNNGFSQKHTV